MNRFYVIAIILLTTASSVVGQPSDSPRVVVKLGDVVVSPTDTIARVPVYVTNQRDSIAGIELYALLEHNTVVSFRPDLSPDSGLADAVDTIGALMSGWEWIGANSFEGGLYDLKLSGMVDWPGGKITPPVGLNDRGVLAYLVFNVEADFVVEDTTFSLRIDPGNSSVADPHGNTIGIVTTIERECVERVGDSCLTWKTVRVGRLDTTITSFRDGSITISDSAVVSD